MKDKVYRHHLRIAVIYFCVAAVLGLLLRSYPIFSFRFNYRYMVHTHSHIALLGWVYVALTTLLHYGFVEKQSVSKRYKQLFWGTQGTLIGMLLTFPFQGYALFSIIFSTLFLIMSYFFTYHFWKNIDPKLKDSKGLKCVKTALVFMVVSSIGPWVLGIIMNTIGAQSIWYRLSIYFYLHFQYNGWMILALIGLFIYALEQRGLEIPNKSFNRFFLSLNLGIVFTFFLSTLWTDPPTVFYILSGIGAISQLYALTYFWSHTKNDVTVLSLSRTQSGILKVGVALGLIKVMLQLLTVIPFFTRMAATYLDFTIGYLHLTLLGVISLGLFFFMDYFGLMNISKKSYLWYVSGFILSEILIFYKGLFAWIGTSPFYGNTEVLALSYIPIPMSLVIILIQNRSKI
ncbi:MAG: hypothetical protein VX798_16945 [Bacteroidota bacterium]|nr:hypothetical protein [Bacteroidota bacterium]